MINLDTIHNEIEKVSNALEDLVDQVDVAGEADARAEAAYKSAYSQARLKVRADAAHRAARITVDEVEDRALVACEDLHLRHLIAKNNLTTVREALKAREARLDALRTLAASFRIAGG